MAGAIVSQVIVKASKSTIQPCIRRGFGSTIPRCSHIGASPIILPSTVTCQAGSSSQDLLFTSPSGKKRLQVPDGILPHLSEVDRSNAQGSTSQNVVTFSCNDGKSRNLRSQWGLTRTLAANAVRGLSEGFSLPIRLVGVGFRASVETIETPVSSEQRAAPAATPSKQLLTLRLGYPRPLRFYLPADVKCTLPSPTEIVLQGQDKEVLGQFAASVRKWRKPEPYNGKGVFVGGETVRKKEVRKK